MKKDILFPSTIPFLGMDITDYKSSKFSIDEALVKQAAELFKPLYLQNKYVSSGMSVSWTLDGYKYLSQNDEIFENNEHNQIDDMFINVSALVGDKQTPLLFAIKTVDGKIQAMVKDCAAINAKSPYKKMPLIS